jgi:dGTPase
MPNQEKRKFLQALRLKLDEEEAQKFSPWACLSRQAVRRKEESKAIEGHRQSFSLDGDRILHSKAYSRYIDKTQVFYLIKHDHITHRVLHVQLVSKIARTIGRLLRLNEDLIEAIALGHDIGHAPFGHEGERFLSELSRNYGLGHFLHNIQGVRFLEKIERKGQGWNLTLQVLDGILCHDGELHEQTLKPDKTKDFQRLDQEIRSKEENPVQEVWPMTMEGCAVRMADTISYIGRDIEDAIRLRLIKRNEIPADCRAVLGDTNGTIVYTLVEDLVANSLEKPFICFSPEVGQALERLKAFNYDAIYKTETFWKQTRKIKLMFKLLFEKYMQDVETKNEQSDIYREFLADMSPEYKEKTGEIEMVRDFIAGMTDEYFLAQCHKQLVPQQILPPGLSDFGLLPRKERPLAQK